MPARRHQLEAAGASSKAKVRSTAGQAVAERQDVQRSKLREMNRRSREIRRRGRSLRNKLAAGVQSVFGVDSMALLAFGVKPRLQKPRRRLTPDEKSSSWKRSSRR